MGDSHDLNAIILARLNDAVPELLDVLLFACLTVCLLQSSRLVFACGRGGCGVSLKWRTKRAQQPQLAGSLQELAGLSW